MSRRRFYMLFAIALCGLLILLSVLRLETHAQAPTKGVAWTDVPCSEFQ